MSYTEAQKKASIKYMSEKTDDIRLRVPKGLKDKYRKEAEKRGMSMTQFIINCVTKEINDT
jgi:predicted HicB family RNase H-like nuclease